MALPQRRVHLYLSTLLVLVTASRNVADAAATTARRDRGVQWRSAGRIRIVSASRGFSRSDWCSSRANAAVTPTPPHATLNYPSLGPRV